MNALRVLLVVPLAFLLLMLAPAGGAGTLERPEVQDRSGDTTATLDIVSAWVTADDANVTFHLGLAQVIQPAEPTQACGDPGCAAGALAFQWQFRALDPAGNATPTLEGYAGSYLMYRHGPDDAGTRTEVGYFNANGGAVHVGQGNVAVAGNEVAMTLPRSHAILAMPEGATPGPYRIAGLMAVSQPQTCTPPAGSSPAECRTPPAAQVGLGGASTSPSWDRAPDAGTGIDFVFASPPPTPTVTLTQTQTSLQVDTVTATETPGAESHTVTLTDQPYPLFESSEKAPLDPLLAVTAVAVALGLARRACR